MTGDKLIMIEMDPKILAYHCNDSDRVNKFLDGSLAMIYSQDSGKWLGNGMYFWDNQSNAEYWKNNKITQNNRSVSKGESHQKDYIICCTILNLKKLLDLTDEKVCEYTNTVFKTLEDRGVKSLSHSEATLSQKINLIFKEVSYYAENFNVLKINGYYPNSDENEFIEDNYSYNPQVIQIKSKKTPQPTNKTKVIYKATNEEPIFDRDLI